MSAFQECWDRLDRADAHAKCFIGILGKILDDKPYRIVPKLGNDGKTGCMVAEPLVEIRPVLFALELGEFFYQLRAALDAVIWKAYERLGTSKPAANVKHLYFPIIETTKTYKDATFHCLNLPNELRVWLRSVQPCHASEYAKDSEEAGIRDALVVINRCAAIDRHRHLHVVGAYISNSTATIQIRPAPARITYQHTVPADFFKGQFVVAEFGVADARGETEIAASGNFCLDISVDEIPASMGTDLGSQLWHLAQVAKDIVRLFEKNIP